MLYIFVSLFAVLLVLNAAMVRTILFPSNLLCTVWLVSLLGLLASGTDFFPISFETLLVFFVGATAFSVGGLLGLLVDENLSQRQNTAVDPFRKQFIDRLLNISFVVVLIGFPFYVQAMIGLAQSAELETFIYRVRQDMVGTSGETGFSVISNLTVLSNYLAMAAWYENDGSVWNRRRAYLCVFVALAYGWLTGSKGAAVLLLMTLFFVHSMRARKVSPKAVVISLSLLAVAFSVGLLMVNLVFTTFESAEEMLVALVKGVQNYWLGGMVAFDQIVADTEAMESHHRIDRFFLQTANSFGGHFSVPSIHAEYSDITPLSNTDFFNTNVYTIYFSYFKDFGWAGAIILMAFLGFVLNIIFKRAELGRPIAVLLYSMTATGVVMTIYAETFWIGLNGYIKAFLFFALLYHFPLSMVPRNTREPLRKQAA